MEIFSGGQLLPAANEWLAANPGLEVVTCESAEAKLTHNQGGIVNNEETMFYESGKYQTWFVRMLRLWLRPRLSQDGAGPTQISYLNVVPACLGGGGTFSVPQFASFGQTIDSINEMFQTNPLPGKIINVETLDVKFENWHGSVDPDITFWAESGKYSTFFLNLVRIFYKQGPPAHERIGTIDFVPPGLQVQYSSLMDVANQWLQSQPPMNIVSMQSIDYKLDRSWDGAALDTQRTLYRESGRYATCFVRILRVTFLTTGQQAPPRNPIITYRTFEPYRTGLGAFETLSQTMARAQTWLRATGVKPIATETVPAKMYGQNHTIGVSEQTYTVQSGRFSTYFLLCIRLYFDQPYTEPPPEVLPPVPNPPPVQSAVICNIL